MVAELVFIHFRESEDGHRRRMMYLLQMHMGGPLGNIIPQEYHMHERPTLDLTAFSINIVMTNGGGPINTDRIAEVINSAKVFGQVEVGKYGTAEIQ